MDAEILKTLLRDFETMSAEEYRVLCAQAVERSKNIHESILIDDIYQSLLSNPVYINQKSTTIDESIQGFQYETHVISVYVHCDTIISISQNGANSWQTAA